MLGSDSRFTSTCVMTCSSRRHPPPADRSMPPSRLWDGGMDRSAGGGCRREEHVMTQVEVNRESLPSILLVDDDEVLRERLATAIRSRGYEVRTDLVTARA